MTTRIWNRLHIIRNDVLCRGAYKLGVRRNDPLEYPVDNAVDDLRSLGAGGKVILLAGHMFIDGQIDYVRRLSETMRGFDLVVIDERSSRDGHKTTDARTARLSDNLWIAEAPDILWKDAYQRFEDVPADDPRLGVPDKEYCAEAVENLRRRHYDLGERYPELIVSESYRYATEVLKLFSPRVVIMWNQYHAFHTVLSGACGDLSTPVVYMEFGYIPHTYAFDVSGQMGRNRISSLKYRFESSCGEAEAQASALLSGWAEEMRAGAAVDGGPHQRPGVLYIGQNDCESGIIPYTEKSRKTNSPTFRDSQECLEFLSSLCRSKDWKLTYRPHPIYVHFELMRNCYNLAEVDWETGLEKQILESDVIVTILSRTAYSALTLGKPVVMLGYTPLRGKGCTYEAFDERSIEPALEDAIEHGLTDEMKESYLAHVSDLVSSHLYDDLSGHGVGLGIDRLSGMLADVMGDGPQSPDDGGDVR